MLRSLPAYSNASLLRSRDQSRLSTCTVVVDVGGEYNSSIHRYDHHQRTFDHRFPNRNTKLSSAGLVWLHFGKAIVATEVGQSEDAPEVTTLWEKLYTDFVEAIDAHDNGISVYDPARLAEAGVEKRFSDGGHSISAAVGDLNPDWNDPIPDEPDAAQEAEDARFQEASRFIGDIFRRKLLYYAKSWLPARSLVEAAYADRTKYDPQGRILVLDQSLPWKAHLYAIEDEQRRQRAGETKSSVESVLYVLYEKPAEESSRWRIQAVPVAQDSFESRKPLPESWRGLRDDDLVAVTGVPGSSFVHASGFIGGNRSWEGALAMTRKALE